MLKSVGRWMIVPALVLGTSPVAWADSPSPGTGVTNCAELELCVGASDPGSAPSPGQTLGSGGSGDSGGGIPTCSWNGQQWPCWDKTLGWFSTVDGCYYDAEVPQPPAGADEWQGQDASKGAVYRVNCRQTDGGLTPKQPVFLANAPGGGMTPPPNPGQIALSLLKSVKFTAPELHSAPGGTAVVGVPVWLWYVAPQLPPGALHPSVTVRGVTVKLDVSFDHVAWDTDDGTGGKTCNSPGTPYTQGAAPDDGTCLYTYKSSSAQKKDQSFALRATQYWNVAVTVNGAKWDFPTPYKVETVRPLPLKVAEVQALN
jgi:hypothetical protein